MDGPCLRELREAVRTDDLDELSNLWSDYDFREGDESSRIVDSLLHLAAQYGSLRCTRKLLWYWNADRSARDMFGDTALDIARTFQQAAVMRELEEPPAVSCSSSSATSPASSPLTTPKTKTLPGSNEGEPRKKKRVFYRSRQKQPTANHLILERHICQQFRVRDLEELARHTFITAKGHVPVCNRATRIVITDGGAYIELSPEQLHYKCKSTLMDCGNSTQSFYQKIRLEDRTFLYFQHKPALNPTPPAGAFAVDNYREGGYGTAYKPRMIYIDLLALKLVHPIYGHLFLKAQPICAELRLRCPHYIGSRSWHSFEEQKRKREALTKEEREIWSRSCA